MSDQPANAPEVHDDLRVNDLDFLMRHIEKTLEKMRADQETVKREPETREARTERDIGVRQRIHYLDELITDLFTLMRNWNDLPSKRTVTRSRGKPDGLAIVVGHTASQPGASGQVPPFEAAPWQAKHEYAWNSHLAEMMREKAAQHGIRAAVFFRDNGGVPQAYREVEEWNPECTVELHFNAASESARGTEVIYGGDASDGSKEWSQALQDEMVTLYGREGRLDRKIKHHRTTGRGGASLEKVHPSAIIEPFFGSNAQECELALERKEGLALALLRAFATHTGRAWTEPSEETQPSPAVQPEPAPAPPPAEQPAPTVASAPTPPSPAAAPAAETSATSPAVATSEQPATTEVQVAASQLPSPTGAKKPPTPAPAAATSTPSEAAAAPTATAGATSQASTPAAAKPPINPAAIVSSVASTIAAIEGGGSSAASLQPSPHAAGPKPAKFEDNFWELALLYGNTQIEFPHLRGITLAQWALECGYGKSKLALEHLNFAGMKWREVMQPYATPVSYEAHDGRTDYCKFASLELFIKGYWARLDLVSAYDGWRDHTETPEAFIGYIAETWAPKQNYEEKVVKLYRQLQADAALPFEQTPVA